MITESSTGGVGSPGNVMDVLADHIADDRKNFPQFYDSDYTPTQEEIEARGLSTPLQEGDLQVLEVKLRTLADQLSNLQLPDLPPNVAETYIRGILARLEVPVYTLDAYPPERELPNRYPFSGGLQFSLDTKERRYSVRMERLGAKWRVSFKPDQWTDETH